jgi:hypothetical protein
MPRRPKGLTAAQVEKGTRPGRYGDGAGLYLLVCVPGRRSCGRVAVSLADARAKI